MRKFLRCLIVLLLIYLSSNLIFGQTNPNTCINSDFSLGDFTNWVGYYGGFYNPSANQGIISGRHTIINGGTFDNNTDNVLFTVPPGASSSARIGNEHYNAEAEQLRYSISVTPERNLFIYKYAVVLQDYGHPIKLQPSFTIEVYDNLGNLFDTVCGYYYVAAQQGLPGWHTSGIVVWKDWTTVGIDLSPYIGQTISIVFTTRDCEEGLHFGYAYISAYCSNLQILYGYCPNDSVASVTAPPGFTYQWGNGETTQTITVHNPQFGEVDSCILTSVNGCKVTIYGYFTPTIVKADFVAKPVCFGMPTSFTDNSTINQNQIVNWKWDFGDSSGQVTNVQNPVHQYNSDGVFNARAIVYSTDGCPDTVSKYVEVVPIPVPEIKADYYIGTLMPEDTIYYHKQVNILVQEGNDVYKWDNGDTTFYTTVLKDGWYNVTIENAGLCSVTDSVMMIESFVDLFMPNSFSPNDDRLNDYFRPVTKPEKVRTFSMIIYNRWGEKIFETNDVLFGWDGISNGKKAPTGEYVYVLTYVNPGGNVSQMKGLFSLVR